MKHTSRLWHVFKGIFGRIFSIASIIFIFLPLCVIVTGIVVCIIIILINKESFDNIGLEVLKYKSEGMEAEVRNYEDGNINTHNFINNSLVSYYLHRNNFFQDDTITEEDCIELSLRWVALIKSSASLDMLMYIHNNDTLCGVILENGYYYMASSFNVNSSSLEFRRINEQQKVVSSSSFTRERIKIQSTNEFAEAYATPKKLFVPTPKIDVYGDKLVNYHLSSMNLDGIMGVLVSFYRILALQEHMSKVYFNDKDFVSFILQYNGKLPVLSNFEETGIFYPFWKDLQDSTGEAILAIKDHTEARSVLDLFNDEKIQSGSDFFEYDRKYMFYNYTKDVHLGSNAAPWLSAVTTKKRKILDVGAYLKEIIIATSIINIIFAFLITTCISFFILLPIRKVANEMRKLSQLDIQPGRCLDRSHFSHLQPVEVKNMIEALFTMKLCLQKLKLYLPVHIIEMLIKESTIKPFMVKENLTVSFSDIVGFSTFSNQLSSQQLLRIMSDFYIYTTSCVQKHGGWIIELLGDALFVVYGLNRPNAVKKRKNSNGIPIEENHAVAAVMTCIEMDKILHSHNPHWNADDLPSIHMRHGIASGDAWCGCVGSSNRMQYTAIGIPVQKAHTLESLGKTLSDSNGSILMDENAYRQIPRNTFDVSWVSPFGDYDSHIYRVDGYYKIKNSMERDFNVDKDYLKRAWNSKLYDRVARFSKILLEKWKNDKLKLKSLSYILELASKKKLERDAIHVTPPQLKLYS